MWWCRYRMRYPVKMQMQITKTKSKWLPKCPLGLETSVSINMTLRRSRGSSCHVRCIQCRQHRTSASVVFVSVIKLRHMTDKPSSPLDSFLITVSPWTPSILSVHTCVKSLCCHIERWCWFDCIVQFVHKAMFVTHSSFFLHVIGVSNKHHYADVDTGRVHLIDGGHSLKPMFQFYCYL